MNDIDFYENHQQGEGGSELSQEEKEEQKKDEEETEKRVEQAEADPEVLATPTEIRGGGSSGNLTGNQGA